MVICICVILFLYILNYFYYYYRYLVFSIFWLIDWNVGCKKRKLFLYLILTENKFISNLSLCPMIIKVCNYNLDTILHKGSCVLLRSLCIDMYLSSQFLLYNILFIHLVFCYINILYCAVKCLTHYTWRCDKVILNDQFCVFVWGQGHFP